LGRHGLTRTRPKSKTRTERRRKGRSIAFTRGNGRPPAPCRLKPRFQAHSSRRDGRKSGILFRP
jgi:hypothetical protein